MRAARKPTPLTLRDAIRSEDELRALCGANIAMVDRFLLTPRDLRRLAKWCARAADYLDRENRT